MCRRNPDIKVVQRTILWYCLLCCTRRFYLLRLWIKSWSTTLQTIALKHHFPVVIFIMLYRVAPTFESVDEILIWDHSTEICWATYFKNIRLTEFSWRAFHWLLQLLLNLTTFSSVSLCRWVVTASYFHREGVGMPRVSSLQNRRNIFAFCRRGRLARGERGARVTCDGRAWLALACSAGYV